jgi:hypothetical protein
MLQKLHQMLNYSLKNKIMKLFTFFSNLVKNTKQVKYTLFTLFWATIVFAGISIIQSCEENMLTSTSEFGKLAISHNSVNESFADMTFGNTQFTFFTQTSTLDSCSNGKAILSNFQVKKGNTVVYNTTFELDTTIRHYRLLQHKKIEQIAKSLNNNLTEDDYAYLSASMETFINEIIKTKTVKKISLQSLFFHKAIVNAKKREKQTGVLECVPNPFYILGQSFYSDIKDINIPKQTAQNVLKSHPEIKNSKGVPELNAFLNNLKIDNISFDQIYFLFVDKQQYIKFLEITPNESRLNLMQKSSPRILNKQGVSKSEGGDCGWWCLIGCGSDWGCCGNYEGCCLIWNPLCYLHDDICTCCEYVEFCLPGCVPDPGCGSW